MVPNIWYQMCGTVISTISIKYGSVHLVSIDGANMVPNMIPCFISNMVGVCGWWGFFKSGSFMPKGFLVKRDAELELIPTIVQKLSDWHLR